MEEPMPKFFYNVLHKSLHSKFIAITLVLTLAAGTALPQVTYADVVDGEIPVKAVISLSNIFNSINTGTETTPEDYRNFFKDMVDTSNVLRDEFEMNKKQLQMVAKKLAEFEETTIAELTTFETLLTEYNERIKYYEMIKGALVKSTIPEELSDKSLNYKLIKSGSENYTQLNVQLDGTWEITELKDGIVYNLASVTPDGYAAVKVNTDYEDTILISGTIEDLYIGEMSDFFTNEGVGTRYNLDGSVDSGKWSVDKRDGLHYIVNMEEEYKAVTQFKHGAKHGMSSYKDFDSDNIYTRIFINNKINGYSYSEINYADYMAEVLYYYEEEERLPLAYINYPDKDLMRMVIGEEDEQIEIYDTDKHDRMFITAFKDGKPDGFGYTVYGDIEYIGTFNGFDILGDGNYYNVNEEENVFDAKVDEIIAEIIERDMTDRQKILAVHDYVVETVTYHKPFADVSEHPSVTHTAYGALMNGSAVCDGYAQAFKVLLDELDIENHLIFGITADANGVFQDYNRHAWNIVKYNNQYTHFDPTWDDPTYSDRVRHTYYFMSSDEIREDHKWTESEYEMYLAPPQ